MKLNPITFFLACIVINPLFCHIDPLESMQKSMKVMGQEMQSMFDNMNKMHQDFIASWKKESVPAVGQEGINLSIDESDESQLKVIISGIQADQFDATFGDKELVIKAPTATVTLNCHHTLLSASIDQEIKEETTDKKDKEKKISRQLFSSSSHIQQMISKPIIMEDAKIEYNKESKTLTVAMPFKDQKKTAKNIPVNVK